MMLLAFAAAAAERVCHEGRSSWPVDIIVEWRGNNRRGLLARSWIVEGYELAGVAFIDK